jgi:hypothetical protein
LNNDQPQGCEALDLTSFLKTDLDGLIFTY